MNPDDIVVIGGIALIVLVVLGIIIAAMVEEAKEASWPIQTEPATVEETRLVPGQHYSSTGFNTKGGVNFTSTDSSDKYVVVLQRKSGRYVIEGSYDFYEWVWSKVKVGDRVNIRYKTPPDNSRWIFVGIETKNGTRDV